MPVIKRVPIKGNGSCSFCKLGIAKITGVGLDFPYSEVTEISGASVSVRACDDCLTEIKKKG
jgi:hypothetical protein